MRKGLLRVFVFLCIAAFTFSGAPGRADAAIFRLGKPGTTFSYAATYGAVEQPYTVDTTLLNRPQGLFLDSTGMLFVSEERGSRVVRKDSSYPPIGNTGNHYTSDNTFVNPTDMAKDSDGHLWVTDNSRVVEFDVSATDAAFLQSFPVQESWVTGNDEGHFQGAHGIAFDHLTLPNQHMFVSDTENNRVKVFGFDGDGKAVYLNTIGGAGKLPSLDGPMGVAVDSSNLVYIANAWGKNIQRCGSGNGWTSYNCSPFTMNILPPPMTPFGYPKGISIDANDSILILTQDQITVYRCTTAGQCSVVVSNLPYWATDVDGLPNGDVFITDWNSDVVRRYPWGSEPSVYMGMENVPYETTRGHFNTPWGVTVGADGSIFLVEEYGFRLVKLDASGQQVWTVGTPGVSGDTDTMLGGWGGWNGLAGNPAVDAAGRIYVADSPANRVEIFNPDGSYFDRIGTTYGWGHDNATFAYPVAVTINPANGDILVVDNNNYRVQVFDGATRAYKATIGETNVSGSDDSHFFFPGGAAVDAKGNVFVADTENMRIMKCTYTTGSNYNCAVFAGITGESGNDYARLHPVSVAVDSAGRVFAADDWNNRVQVFDAQGGYIATLSGPWGPGLAQVRSVSGVAVDKAGKVYVTDKINNRVLVYAPGGSGRWVQVNVNGFGNAENTATWSLGWFKDTLYAGTDNANRGAEIWRKTARGDWQLVVIDGLGSSANRAVDHLLAFNGKIYASTYNYLGNGTSNGGEIWRSDSGDWDTWTPVVTGGSGSGTADTVNVEFYRMFLFSNQICATTWTDGTHGAEIWCSPTGDASSWTRLVGNGLVDNPNNIGILDVQAHNGMLYAGTYNQVYGTNVYRSSDGVTWTQLFTDGGWGDAGNIATTAIEEFNGGLYVVFTHTNGYGITLSRCYTCDGTDWQELEEPKNSFGDQWARIMPGLEVHDGSLYMVAGHPGTGLHVWKSADGDHWQLDAPKGFGMPANMYSYWDNGLLSAGGNLYLGAWTPYGSAQVWQLGLNTFLPSVRK